MIILQKIPLQRWLGAKPKQPLQAQEKKEIEREKLK